MGLKPTKMSGRKPLHVEERLLQLQYYFSAILILTFATLTYFDGHFCGSRIVLGILTCVLSIIVFVLYDTRKQQPSHSHSIKSVLQHYFNYTIYYFLARWVLARHYEPQQNRVRETQTEYLMMLLKRHMDTEYGKKFNFAKMKTIADFRKHPLTTYAHYEDYINRTIDSKENIMFEDEIAYVALTSGTTGKNKRFLIPKSESKRCLLHYLMCMPWCVAKLPWRNTHLRKSVSLRLHVNERSTARGVPMGPFSNIGYRMSQSDLFTSPPEAFTIPDDMTMIYVHLVFALYNRDSECIMSVFPSVCMMFFSTLEKNLEKVCEDIETGTLNADLNLSDEKRTVLEKRLFPWPERAAEVHQQCSQGYQGVAMRLWPDAAYVVMIKDGPFRALSEYVGDKYLHGIVRTSFCHGSTESSYGFPLPYGCYGNNYRGDSVYSINPSEAFFEFIPIADVDTDQPQTQLLHEVQVQKEYEIVVSNARGLYRYRSGDVIKIVGHNGQIPLYKFCCRRGDVLNLTFEKLPQTVMDQCVESSMEQLQHYDLKEYTATESFNVDFPVKGTSYKAADDTGAGHYVLFIELEDQQILTESETVIFDEYLMNGFENYKSLRERGQIQPMKVYQVKCGTFQHLTMHMVQSNSDTNLVQFKLPKVLRRKDCLNILFEKTL